MSETKEYTTKLIWAGTKDSAMYRAAFEYCKVVTCFKPSDPEIVTHEEYMALVEEGKARPPESYWGIKEGQVGVVVHNQVGSSRQWEIVSNCKTDFCEGWRACEKMMKPIKKTNKRK